MSIKDFESVELSWITVAGVLNNGNYADIVSVHFDAAYKVSIEAENLVSSLGNVGPLNLNINMNEIGYLHERRRELLSFCNSINYEVAELIDVPFGKDISEIIEDAYHLNPKDITVKTTGIFGIQNSINLASVMSKAIDDSELQKDFNAKVSDLNKDKIEDTLEDEIKNVLFWEKEYHKAEQCKVAAQEVFTKEVRANWNSYNDATKKKYIKRYADKVSIIIGEGKDIVKKFKIEKMDGFGYNSATKKTVAISDEFLKPTNTIVTGYDVDKIIETITHETRHQYQHVSSDSSILNILNVNKYKASDSVVTDWSLPYKSPGAKYKYIDYWKQPVENDARGFAALARD
jgi:hypothetical protein